LLGPKKESTQQLNNKIIKQLIKMDLTQNIEQQYKEIQQADKDSKLSTARTKAFDTYKKDGIPTAKHEEWKYTRIGSLFNKEYSFAPDVVTKFTKEDLSPLRLPGYEVANELVFVNGFFSLAFSTIRSQDLYISSIKQASDSEYGDVIAKHFGNSSKYLKDGVNALNTALFRNSLFIHIKKGTTLEHPIYIYNITDARNVNILSQPRSFIYAAEAASVQIVETYATLGNEESFTNQVMEIIVEQDAHVEYYKIQNDSSKANVVSTTHIRQIGKSYTHSVTISLEGGIIRNNLNMVLDADHAEAHLYGLYLLKGNTHVDNHTIVDNLKPNCQSNELYKGIMDENATGVFNGKIFVERLAQKTNAYQSNKNVLLSDTATVNTKPQLEIFADDVKCSHGCTIGQLDEEGLFYLQSRGISENVARSLLLHAFADDILEMIKLKPIRQCVDRLISERLEYQVHD
jgi:Fe-S cluster assembly protein SufD